jgi:CheY-like chemotaxis protein
VALKVSDTGTGMTPEVAARIFEPFFTTKARGKGTGLGLSTVQHIMREHSGWIEATSEPGMGATFTAYFPRALVASSARSTGANHAAVAEKTRGGSIFVIEDEAPVRDLLVRVLTGRGHKVVSAESADAALRVWEENRDNLDLLLTDIVLPGGMSGRELAAQFQRQRPGIKVLYMSGYINDANDREFMRQAQHQLLQKPFPLDQLLKLVRELLDEARDAEQQHKLPA